jgi:hypothetical protein
MKQPCITLEGVVCNSEYSNCRLNCPRAIPAYWREVWLERVTNHSATSTRNDAASTGATSGGAAPESCAPLKQRDALPVLGSEAPKAGALAPEIAV